MQMSNAAQFLNKRDELPRALVKALDACGSQHGGRAGGFQKRRSSAELDESEVLCLRGRM